MVDSPGVAGFWSYTHDDDRDEGGRITRLAERLKAEFALLTGDDLEVFVDRSDLAWGDQWRSRIDEALASTTFFIPVITPRYFRSAECRKELLTFAGHARSLGVEELLLPLLYVEPLGLSRDAEDEAVALVAATQYEPWMDLRLVDEESSEYRQAVNRLAQRLAEISATVASRPQSTATEVVEVAASEGEEEAPGQLDLLARGEEAIERWGVTLERFPVALERVTEVTGQATQDMEQSDARGQGFVGRLKAARRFARDLDEPSREIEELGRSYASDLVEVDPAILTLIRYAQEAEPGESDAEIAEFLGNIRGLAKASREAIQGLEEMAGALDQASTVSREFRPQLQRIEAGLRGVLDAQAIIDEWERRIDAVEGPSTPSPEEPDEDAGAEPRDA